MLQTAQDETPARRIIRHIDEVRYDSAYSVMAFYGEDREQPDWKAIECSDGTTAWIINESSKRENRSTSIVVHSTDEFARNHAEEDPDKAAQLLLERSARISGEEWLALPEWKAGHHWKYSRCLNPIEETFMELEMEEAPLALVGDYFGGHSPEDAYLSGSSLADYWIQKYSVAESERLGVENG